MTELSPSPPGPPDRMPHGRTAPDPEASVATGTPCFVIEPRKTFLAIDVRELWAYRDLFYFLAWRDVLLRYKQTVLGAAWAILQPFAAMIVFTIFFGRLAKMPSDGLPYPLFAYSALVLWSFLAQSVTVAANSLVGNERLVTKIYFPRMLLVAAPICAAFLDFLIASVLLLFLIPYFGYGISANIWAIPIMIVITMCTALGTGLFLGALTLKYRDFRYVVPFLVQIWMFVSPVVYPARLVPEKWLWLYGLNPMAGAIEGFRWAVLGSETNPWPLIGIGTVSAIIILIGGLVFFSRTEDFFADLI